MERSIILLFNEAVLISFLFVSPDGEQRLSDGPASLWTRLFYGDEVGLVGCFWLLALIPAIARCLWAEGELEGQGNGCTWGNLSGFSFSLIFISSFSL